MSPACSPARVRRGFARTLLPPARFSPRGRARRRRTSRRFLAWPSTSRSRKRYPPIDASGALPVAPVVRLAGAVDDRALDERVGALVARKVPVWLALTAPGSVEAVDPWRAALQRLLARHREGIAILEIEAGADPKLAMFATRLASTEGRAARESIRIALNGSQTSPGPPLAELYSAELAPYVDLLVLPATADRAAASAHLLKVDPDARLAILAGDAGDQADDVARRIIDSQLETVGTDVAIVAWRSSALIPPRCDGSPRLHRCSPATSPRSTLRQRV